MSNPTWRPEARDEDPIVPRHPYKNDPTKNDTAPTAKEQTTVGNGGLSSGPEDPVMPSDEATVNTKI